MPAIIGFPGFFIDHSIKISNSELQLCPSLLDLNAPITEYRLLATDYSLLTTHYCFTTFLLAITSLSIFTCTTYCPAGNVLVEKLKLASPL